MTDNLEPNPIPRNAIRALGEQDRSPEYKSARDNLVRSIRHLLDEVERRHSTGEPLGKHGEIKYAKGIERTILQDPFSEPTQRVSDDTGRSTEAGLHFATGLNFMSEATKQTGAYIYHDAESGQRILAVVDTDSVLEIIDNPLEQKVTGPEAGYSGVSSTILASFKEKLPDNSYVGAQIESSGRFSLKKFDGGYHTGMGLDRDPGQVELVNAMWANIESQLLS